MLPESIIQPVILGGAIVNFFLLASEDARARRWGFLMILVLQVFWYMTGIRHAQWGLVGVTTWYVINSLFSLSGHSLYSLLQRAIRRLRRQIVETKI